MVQWFICSQSGVVLVVFWFIILLEDLLQSRLYDTEQHINDSLEISLCSAPIQDSLCQVQQRSSTTEPPPCFIVRTMLCWVCEQRADGNCCKKLQFVSFVQIFSIKLCGSLICILPNSSLNWLSSIKPTLALTGTDAGLWHSSTLRQTFNFFEADLNSSYHLHYLSSVLLAQPHPGTLSSILWTLNV